MKITKEHLYGDWMREVLPVQLRRSGLASVTHTPTGESVPRHLDIPEYHHQMQVRNVCETCNSGWMSDLEAAAKRITPDLIYGKVAATSANDAALLATWITKCAVMREFLDKPSTRAIPTLHRRWVHETRTPPPHTWVWCARLTNRSQWATSGRHFSLSISEDIPDRVGHVANTHVSSFGFHRLWILVFGSSRGGDYDIRDISVSFPKVFVRLWPGPYPFMWPPGRSVTDALIEELGVGKGILIL